MERRKILWLVSWYPNKLSPYNGDFIKRHAEAVSLYEDIQVIYVIRDMEGTVTKGVYTEEIKKKGLTETIIYYYITPNFFPLVEKYLSQAKYKKLYKRAISQQIKKSWIPALVHVHVGMNAGIIALWVKKCKAIPYVVSEHWTGLLSEATDSILGKPFYVKSLWKRVMTSANDVSSVSSYLANSIKKYFNLLQIRVIPNVINRSIFYPKEMSTGRIQFIHISSLVDFKNTESIIEAFSTVHNNFPSAILNIFGSEKKELKEIVKALDKENNIHFYTEIPQEQLVDYIRQSTALILYSKYETFGCVIIEANACGIPVIVSDIPVFHETVTEGINGLFAAPNNTATLANKMMEIINNRSSFDNKAIAETTASKYNYETVGKQFSDWYSEILLKA